MNDDAPTPGTPDPAADSSAAPPPPPPAPPVPPQFQPDKTVMRPADPQPDETVLVTPGAHDGGHGGAHAGPPAPESPDDTGLLPFGAFEGPDAAAQPGGPIHPEFPTKASKAGSTGALIAVGTGLLGAAVGISAIRSRDTDDGSLDWSNFGVGLGATAVLLLVAILGAVVARRRTGGRAREEVVTWPGVIGILATAVVLNVGIDSDDTWMGYLTGAVLVVLAIIGYVAARRAAFVVVAIAGLAIIYALAFDDFVADSVDGNEQVIGAVLVAVFVVSVTLLGWALPSRAVSGVAVGVAGLVGFVGIMATFVVTRLLGDFFGSMFGGYQDMDMYDDVESSESYLTVEEVGFHESDVWWVLAFAALLTVLWALAAAISNHSGFSLLAIAMPMLMVPLASVALAAERPSQWSGALAASGAVLLLGGVGLTRLRGKKVAKAM
ncbi:hypothetical protein [Nocardioides sp. WS12]|uniref:hypothetical protein n=1 Tax=Nocardioides sp. WS12 TaxID=2486272 RepID=UPI0015FE6B73|nr:hypothetical protein [Nocardioides sp. WS12]